ncbi:MAG: hypothetical protein SGBAC_004581 [Bacillariaceae sp.]
MAFNAETVNENAASIIPNVDIEWCPSETNDQESVSCGGFVDVNLDDAVDELSEGSSLSTDVEDGAESSDDDYSIEETNKALERSDTIATFLLHTMHDKINESTLDPRLGRRTRDFAFAQSERTKRGETRNVMGFYFLITELAIIRADLQWAEDAAWRRENGMPYVSWEDYEDRRKQKSWKRPYLTYATLIVHFCMMIYIFYLSGWKPEPLDVNWTFGPSIDILQAAGGLDTLDMAENGNYSSLVTATFLHSGVIHFLTNALYIFILGPVIEMNHGMTCLFLVYFIPSVAAFVLSGLLNPNSPVTGASGGAFGLIGACIADILVNWNLMFFVFMDHAGRSKCCLMLKAVFWLLLDIAVQFAFGLTPQVDNFAHLGGFIYGFLAGFVVMERLPLSFFGRGNVFRTCRSFTFRLLAATSMAFAIAYSSVELSQSDGRTVPYPMINEHVNCVEFPFWKEDKWWSCDRCKGFPFTYEVAEMDYTNIFDKKISKIYLSCPDGADVVGDVSHFGFSVVEDFQNKQVEGICRRLC